MGKKENVEKMITYLVQDQLNISQNSESNEESQEKEQASTQTPQKSKYPFASCEVFCCEIDPIFTTFLENKDLINLFMSILDVKGSLHCTTAGTTIAFIF